eukprot:347681_1
MDFNPESTSRWTNCCAFSSLTLVTKTFYKIMGNSQKKPKVINEIVHSTMQNKHKYLHVNPDEFWANKQMENDKSNVDVILKSALQSCVMLDKYKLLEWYCIKEMYKTKYWSRDDFKIALQQAYKMGSFGGKLTSVRIIASYCIPDIVTFDEVINDLNGGYVLKGYNGCFPGYSSPHFTDYKINGFENQTESTNTINGIIDEGMRNHAYIIVTCRDALFRFDWKNNYGFHLNDNLLVIIITFIAGDNTFNAIKQMKTIVAQITK